MLQQRFLGHLAFSMKGKLHVVAAISTTIPTTTNNEIGNT